MKKIYIKIVTCLLPVFTATTLAMNAQTTPVSLEILKMKNIWINNTNNAAGGILDAPIKAAAADFEYNKVDGNFKFQQIGNDNSALKFNTNGGGIYKNLNGIYINGSFSYAKDDISGARWNATLIDPLRGMPFFLADSTASKWKNQSYKMGFQVGFPKLFNFLYLGMGANYEVAVAAKQIDPRPYTRMSKIEIKPSLIFEINQNNHFGLNFHYYNYREDGNANNSNSLVDPQGWEIVAPGFFTQGIIGSFSAINTLRNYNANALGGGAQYSFSKNKFKLLLDGNYIYKVEDVTANYTKPYMSGTVKETKWDAGLVMQYNVCSKNLLSFKYKHTNRSIDGIEYFQTYDNTYEIQSWITDAKFIRSNFETITDKVNLDYVIIKEDQTEYSWYFGIDGSYNQDSYIYYVPKSTRDIKFIDMNARIAHNFIINQGNSIVVNIKGGYNKNTKGEFDYNGTRKDNVAYTNFALVDYRYMCTDYTKIGVGFTYIYKVLKKHLMSLYFSGNYDYYSPSGDEFDKRQFITFKIGVAF